MEDFNDYLGVKKQAIGNLPRYNRLCAVISSLRDILEAKICICLMEKHPLKRCWDSLLALVDFDAVALQQQYREVHPGRWFGSYAELIAARKSQNSFADAQFKAVGSVNKLIGDLNPFPAIS